MIVSVTFDAPCEDCEEIVKTNELDQDDPANNLDNDLNSKPRI